MVKEGEERVKLETSTTSKLNRFQNSTIWLENSNQTGVTCLSLIREKLAALSCLVEMMKTNTIHLLKKYEAEYA